MMRIDEPWTQEMFLPIPAHQGNDFTKHQVSLFVGQEYGFGLKTLVPWTGKVEGPEFLSEF